MAVAGAFFTYQEQKRRNNMRKRWSLVGAILLLVSLLLTGCVPKADYEAVVADRDSTLAVLQSVKSQLGSAQAKVSELTSNLGKAEAELTTTQAELTTTQAELTTTQAELTTTQTEYEATKQELTEIKKVYPPDDFSSRSELVDWLKANDVSEEPPASSVESVYSRALKIQQDALKDGYIISVDIDELGEGSFLIACVAIIDGDFWSWGPNSDFSKQWQRLAKVWR